MDEIVKKLAQQMVKNIEENDANRDEVDERKFQQELQSQPIDIKDRDAKAEKKRLTSKLPSKSSNPFHRERDRLTQTEIDLREVREEGFQAGALGHPKSNPYRSGTRRWQAWNDG